MKIIKIDKKTIEKTIKVLKNSGLVIFPSDTVYGLLVDATNEKAVEKLTDFKNRPAGKPVSVFVNDELLNKNVELNDKQRKTLGTLFPGSFTAILKSKHKVSKNLESEKGTLGVRIPDYELINKLVKRFGKAITATSANVSGKAPHHSIESLLKQLSEKKKQLIDLIVDAGKLPRNKPSTIVDLTEPEIKILRRGDVVFKDSQTFLSNSPTQTKKIAKNVLSKNLNQRNKPLVFIIEGELGVGKTIFVKGIGEELGVKDIISPTFVVYYEYDIRKYKKQDTRNKLIHVDLYYLIEDEEFKQLGLEDYLKPGNILCFEWGEKAGKIFQTLKEKGRIVYVQMDYKDEKKREIKVSNLP